MDSSCQFQSDPAVLQISPDESRSTPLIVHHEVLLGELPPRDDYCYILISDDHQRIIGVVAVEEIDRRLLSTNEFERTRWSAMPIGALSKLSFSDSRIDGPKITESNIDCAAIRHGDRLFGLSVDGDLFFSWKRLESLFSAALSDPLTGLMNRLAYERRLQEEWCRSLRTSTSIGVVVVDLDNFKAINDTHGHVVGDQVLCAVARQLESSMRSYDVVARYGGDEFIALCLGCAPGTIDIPISRVLDGLGEISIPVNDGLVTVSASIGAAVQHSEFEFSTPEDLFVAADNCLYQAKVAKNSAWKTEIDNGGDNEDAPVSNIVPVSLSGKDDQTPAPRTQQ